MKVFKPERDIEKLIDAEVEILSMIRHENIVNFIEDGEGVNARTSHPFRYILLELASNGSLYDHVAHTGRFDEMTARHFFAQLLSGINYIHSAGFAHRDIKLENLLLDDFFNLKIADFGFAEYL